MSTVDYHQAIVIGAGVAGIYQIHRLTEIGVDAILLEADADLGGTWYNNRYPGCRFDSESYTYGYSFSRELLDEWHWKETFSSQPENLRYLNFVADKFDLRKHMQFNSKIESAHFDDDRVRWELTLVDGRRYECQFLFAALGLLSAPTLPRVEGLDDFRGQSFHTFDWPHEPVDLAGKRVGVVGTGATGIQVIAEIADKVGHLTVFQRRPNWAAPLHNTPISEQEMIEIRERYDEIFDQCSTTPGSFKHGPDRRGFYEVSREERLEMWERLYQEPGFGIWLANFREIFMDEEANAELSAFIADKIRSRVHDPAVAEKLIPKDHGFGVQRLPLETFYYEAYNRPNVGLIDLQETPIERITPAGIKTTAAEYELDVIVYATGFDAITGAYDRIDIRGVAGAKLRDKWDDGPETYLGILINQFPNLIMLAGPQSVSASTNFPRGIELLVDWSTELLTYVREHGYDRLEATKEAEESWTQHVAAMYQVMLMRKARGWFTGYNSNVEGHEYGKVRHFVYNGGTPKYRAKVEQVAAAGYEGIEFS